MNPSRLFIERPVATSLLMFAILLVGWVAFKFLPLSALPDVDYPTIQVQTFYPGASPEVMASAVTAPLERQFGQMANLSQMLSASSGGASLVTLRFGLDLSIDVAEQEMQAAINGAQSLLPSDLPAPPIYAKVNPADAPILTLGVTSKTMKLTDMEDILENRLVPKLSQLPGVGLATISGGQRPAVRIHANPLALAAYAINLDDLRTTISNLNVNTPKGSFDGPSQSYAVNANDQIRDPADYLEAVVAYRNNAPVRLKDVARVELAAENNRLSAWSGRAAGLIVNIQRQPGANVIQVADSIKKLLPELTAGLPAALDVALLTDRTVTIRASVADVEFELALAVGLVVLVIFLFLRNIPATIIPSLSVPLSLVGALAIMYEFGFSLDNLSLMALTVATGFVVDDAIVVIENIARYLEQGLSPKEAALKGSEQIGFTIISLTVSLLAVLIPLLFMGDVVGRLFHEFAITLAATILISAFVALTLVPMLCALLLKPAAPGKHDQASGGAFFRLVLRFYASTLRVALDYSGVTLLVALGAIALTGYLYVEIPKGFFPIQDTGVIQGVTQASQAISFDKMARLQQEVATAILHDADVQSLSSFIGVDGSNVTLNSGRFLINLKPQAQRKASASEIIRRLNDEVARRRRHLAVPATRAGPLHRHGGQRRAISVHPAKSGSGAFAGMDAQGAGAPQRDPRHHRRRQRSPAQRARGYGRYRPLHRRALRRHARLDRQCALRRVRPAHHLDDLHAGHAIPRNPRRRTRHAHLARRDGLDLSAVLGLDDGAGAAIGDLQTRRAPILAPDLASQAISRHDDLVQPDQGRGAGRGGRQGQFRLGRSRPAAGLSGRLSGRGAGVPVLAVQRSVPARRGGPDHVYRAGRAL